MKTKKSKILLGIIIFLTLVITFTGGFFTSYFIQNKTGRVLGEVYQIIENNAKSPSGNDLSFDETEIVKNFVDNLLIDDDYAFYYSNEEYEKIMSEGKGKYEGIGINLYSNLPFVFSVAGNSPAEKSGLKKMDKVLRARASGQSEFTNFLTSNDVLEFFESNANVNSFEMVIERAGEGEKTITLSPESYIASYVEYYDNQNSVRLLSNNGEKPKITEFEEENNLILDDETAIIVFKAFEGDASSQLKEVLEYFYKKGKSKLILDLRDNGGGYMSSLKEVASCFIYNEGKSKSLITTVEESKGYTKYYTCGNNFNTQLKNVVVLANENTASASECLIGAMLYYGDANFSIDNLLIEFNAERKNYSTYGKGIMQTTYKLLSGGALKLTTARIYQPDEKTCIHDKGIVQEKVKNQITSQNAISRAVEILAS